MTVLLGYESALEYWRTMPLYDRACLGGAQSRARATRRARRLWERGEKPCMRDTRRPGGCTLPLKALVSSRQARVSTAQLSGCVWTTPLPASSFVGFDENFLASTPEFCFFQMSRRLSLVRLIELGFELCGTYSLIDGEVLESRGFSLTSSAKLRSFTEGMRGVAGREKSLRAARYVADGSASPRETDLFLLLTLPHSLGGYALKGAVLNHRVDLPSSTRRRPRFYVCDICWPKEKVAVEYESDEHHLGHEKFARDSHRRSELEGTGCKVFTMTNAELQNGGSFNRVAHALAKSLGQRLRYRDPGFTRNHLELRRELGLHQ